MAVYYVNRSINPKLLVNDRFVTAEDGSIEIDLGYGNVKVNPKHITFLMEVKVATKEDFSSISADKANQGTTININSVATSSLPLLISGLTEEQYDAQFLHAFGVYAGSQAKYDPTALTDAQRDLLQKVIEDDIKRSRGRE